MKPLKQQVIEHWQRMIKWAKKQPKDQYADKEVMRTAIGEVWLDSGCAWCKWYAAKIKQTNTLLSKCNFCPLGRKYGKCTGEECENLWVSVNASLLWEAWTKKARLFLK